MYNLIFLCVPRHVTQLSCNQIVSQTAKDLQRLTVVVKKGDKQQKLQAEKLTSDFKDAVQCYSRLQKVHVTIIKTVTLFNEIIPFFHSNNNNNSNSER